MTDGDLLTYNGELCDDSPQVVAQFGYSWRKFLIAATAYLANPEMWEPGTDMLAVEQQVDELINRLMGNEAPVSTGFSPIVWDWAAMWRGTPPDLGAIDNTMIGMGYVYQQTPVNMQTEWKTSIALPPGEYLAKVHHYTATNAGIGELKLVGPSTIVIGYWDGYTASPVPNTLSEFTFYVGNSGFYELQVKPHNKNALSSNYYLIMQRIVITRVGDVS